MKFPKWKPWPLFLPPKAIFNDLPKIQSKGISQCMPLCVYILTLKAKPAFSLTNSSSIWLLPCSKISGWEIFLQGERWIMSRDRFPIFGPPKINGAQLRSGIIAFFSGRRRITCVDDPNVFYHFLSSCYEITRDIFIDHSNLTYFCKPPFIEVQ